MRPQGKLVLLAAFALFLGLGCQIADVLADKPTPQPTLAPAAGPVAVPTARPAATSTVLVVAPTSAVLVVAPTLAPTPAATAVPLSPTASPTSEVVAPTSSPIAQSANCPNPNAAITSPGMNGTVSGLLEIRGTATQPDMQYWKVEFRTDTATTYSALNNTTTAVTDGVLARWSTKTVPNGAYFVRLVIVQKDGNFAAPCEIRITVSN